MYHFAYIFLKIYLFEWESDKRKGKTVAGEREFSIYGFTAQVATGARADPIQGQEQGASSAFFWISQVGGWRECLGHLLLFF